VPEQTDDQPIKGDGWEGSTTSIGIMSNVVTEKEVHTVNKGRARANSDSDSDTDAIPLKKAKSELSEGSTCDSSSGDDKLQRMAQAMKTIIEVGFFVMQCRGS